MKHPHCPVCPKDLTPLPRPSRLFPLHRPPPLTQSSPVSPTCVRLRRLLDPRHERWPSQSPGPPQMGVPLEPSPPVSGSDNAGRCRARKTASRIRLHQPLYVCMNHASSKRGGGGAWGCVLHVMPGGAALGKTGKQEGAAGVGLTCLLDPIFQARGLRGGPETGSPAMHVKDPTHPVLPELLASCVIADATRSVHAWGAPAALPCTYIR